MAGMSLDQFLNKDKGGGSSNRLKKWNKRDSKSIRLWLHTRAQFHTVWNHSFSKYVEQDDKAFPGGPEKQIWSTQFYCNESEDVLRQQFFRDRETGERKNPPKSCGHCRLIEATRMAVEAGKIHWLQPIFKFDGVQKGQPTTKIWRAAGIWGGFKIDKMNDAQQTQFAELGIKIKDAWQYSQMARKNYVFTVVDHDNPEEGVRVAVEGAGLGDSVSGLIAGEMQSKGGNPLETPYCIKWEYDKDAKNPSDKYKAIRLRDIELTPEIKKLIESDPPPLGGYTRPTDQKIIRAAMEEHYCGPKGLFDWDELFPVVEVKEPEKPAERIVEVSEGGVTINHPPSEPKEEVREVTFVSGSPEPEMVECDECKKPMGEDLDVCPHCGFDYGAEAKGTTDPAPAPEANKSLSEQEWPSEDDAIPWGT